MTDYRINCKGKDDSFFKNIAEKLNTLWKDTPCNFEDIFHTVEMLYSYKWCDYEKDYFKPPFEAFIIPKPDDKGYYFSPNRLKKAEYLITIIADEVERYEKDFQINKDNNHKWFTEFWKKAVSNCEWNIATLNYDTCLENSIDAFEDGYQDTGNGYYRFNPIQIREPGLSKILHLHGCIFYGYPPNSNKSNYFEKDPNDLYKFNNYSDARQSWTQRLSNTNQSRETSIIGRYRQ